jgi:5'-3' exonuclease
LKEGEEEALFSKMLATIRRDAPIDFKLPDHDWKDDVDIKKVEGFFRSLGFRSLQVRLTEILGKTDAFGDEIDGAASAKAPDEPKEEVDENQA